MRWLRASLLLTISVAAGGCFQSYTVVKVNVDGSGIVEQRLLFTTAALSQLRSLAALRGGGNTEFDPFSEEQARKMAGTLGPGVTYVSSEPIRGGDSEGRLMKFAFADITQVRIQQQPAAPGGAAVGASSDPGRAVTFSMTRQADGNALLRIIVPEPSMPGLGPSPSGGAAAPPPAAQMAMIKQMLTGARLSIAVEPAGRLVRTSSPFVDGQRVTLLEVDLDQLLADEARFMRLHTAASFEDAKALMKDMPGLKFAIDPEITIEFAAR